MDCCLESNKTKSTRLKAAVSFDMLVYRVSTCGWIDLVALLLLLFICIGMLIISFISAM